MQLWISEIESPIHINGKSDLGRMTTWISEMTIVDKKNVIVDI